MLNQVLLIGHLGRDPDERVGNGPLVFSLATSERWRERHTGESRQITDWHTVVVFEPGLIDVCERFLRKGSKVYLEGKVRTRSWVNKAGATRYVTEIVLQGPRAKIVLLDRREGGRPPPVDSDGGYGVELESSYE